jgi:hypothetical protein
MKNSPPHDRLAAQALVLSLLILALSPQQIPSPHFTKSI